MKLEDIKKKKIGFLGLGAIGHPQAYFLCTQGFQLVLPGWRKDIDLGTGARYHRYFAKDHETKMAYYNEMVEKYGAYEASSMQEMCEMCEIFYFSLPHSRFVKSNIMDPGGILEYGRPGSVIFDATSGDPMITKECAEALEEKGIYFLDTPISGGVHKVLKHELSMMVGGRRDIFDEYLPFLQCMAHPAKIEYCGPSGAGDVVKSCNNFLSASSTTCHAEALMVAAKFGVDPVVANRIFDNSSAKSWSSSYKFPDLVFPGLDFGFTQDLMLKDLLNFNKTADDLRVPHFIGNSTMDIWEICRSEYGGDADNINVVRMMDSWSGTHITGIPGYAIDEDVANGVTYADQGDVSTLKKSEK